MYPKDIRIVFMGTPDFAVESLKALVEKGYQVVGVITAPDKPAGRGRQLSESAVKQYGVQQNLKVIQPEKLKNPEFIAELESLKADLQIVVAFRMLPEIVWKMPLLGTFNLHASLLPQYRGAAPLNWAIINGETETGATTFLLSHEIDTGRIIFQEKVTIGDNDTVGDLHDRMMGIGATLVLKTVDALAEGKIQPIDQEKLIDVPDRIKQAPKIFKEDCRIDWIRDTESVRNLIRGLSPYPAAWIELVHPEKHEILSAKIYAAIPDLTSLPAAPGTIRTDAKKFLKIACPDGWLSVTDIQLSGKKRMKIDELLRGFHDLGEWKIKM
ncbi:MAG: methionyl-tRNA formyltransferase [Bacteroidota bacterium]|nr:methionyl-tRNA formyltransferase [Odoribacter sp.]MDP3643166.1 methionyl-tRNA formyltransferase [Bacteroidota bacterium]